MRTPLFLAIVFISQLVFPNTQVDTVAVYSEAMKKEIKSVVITPESYSVNTKYPVLYLLHGYSGDYSDWVKKVPSIKQLASKYDMIIVCPDGAFSSWYFDSPVDPNFQYESYITQDLIKFVDKNYSTIQDRTGRAITGLSMGGHGAMYLAIIHRDLFAHAGSMSGAVNIILNAKSFDLLNRLGKTFEEAPELWHAHSVVFLVEKLQNKDLNIIIDCGVNDFLYEINAALHQKLIQLHIDHDYIERPGEHTWEYWTNAIQYQLLYFDRCFDRRDN